MRQVYMILVCICLSAYISACGSSGSTPASTQRSAPNPAPSPSPSPSPASSNDPVITVYTETVTRFAIVNQHPYQVTGSCVVYNSQTYCWDDGFHNVVVPGTTLIFDYWMEQLAGGVIITCGGCQIANTDAMTAPTVLSSDVETVITMAAVNHLLSAGTQADVHCTISGSVLDCGTFQIDTAQTPL